VLRGACRTGTGDGASRRHARERSPDACYAVTQKLDPRFVGHSLHRRKPSEGMSGGSPSGPHADRPARPPHTRMTESTVQPALPRGAPAPPQECPWRCVRGGRIPDRSRVAPRLCINASVVACAVPGTCSLANNPRGLQLRAGCVAVHRCAMFSRHSPSKPPTFLQS
jgi:hypothetical protein